MTSQKDLIIRQSKVACLGSIIDQQRLDVGLLVDQEMVLRAK